MSSRRPMRGLKRNQRCHLGPFRLVLEPLEARRLLAGINVSVYVDQDGSRSFEPGSDLAAPNRLVYVDLNNNGLHDSHEPIAITDQAGSAFFADLEAGEYAVGLLTNSNFQPQVEPVGVAQPKLIAAQPIANFVASDDLQIVWSLGTDGTARLVIGSDELPTSVPLGNIIALGQPHQDLLTGIVEADLGWEWIEFELRSGEVSRQSLVGLSPTAALTLTPRSIVETQSQTVVLLDGPNGKMLSSVAQLSNQQQFSTPSVTAAYAIAGSPSLVPIAALSSSASGASVLSLLNPRDGFAQVAKLTLEEYASSVAISNDGKFAYVSLSAGGVLAIAIHPESLSLAAILHEAVGPVVASSSDGRIVTGSNRSPRELITWDTRQWQPLARTQLPTGNSPFGRAQVAMEARGDRMLALAGGNLHAIDMSLPLSRRVQLNTRQATAQIRLGVRVEGTSTPRELQTIERAIDEDTDDSFQLSELVTTEDGNHALWFKLDIPAQHGRLQATEDGRWKYVPDPNFFGEDSATLLVYDGKQASELVMRWSVAAVHDAPSSISVGAYSLLENAQHGTLVGPVTVVDPDVEDSYDITTSDDRFQVYGGNLYFVYGSLNYEVEPTISITITALDFYSDFSVSTIATVSIIDVNEKPFSLRLSGGQIPENEPGAVAGSLSIIDPDSTSEYAFYLFDSRFTIRGNTLKLIEGVALDYETEPVIDLTVAATDGTYEIFEVVKIHVIDRDDTAAVASSIELNSRQVDEFLAGAPVGTVSVVNPKDSSYQFTVSDGRFVVVGDLLKLRDDQQVTVQADSPLALTITATGDAGDRASGHFTIAIIANQSPYHNARIPEDVNGDGYVSPIDVLIIVNELNRRGTFPVPTGGTATGEPPAEMPDVNDDGIVSPVDALIIINRLNRTLGSTSSGSGEAAHGLHPEGESPLVAETIALPRLEGEAERRRRENSTIDAELELLLDQLSRAQRS